LLLLLQKTVAELTEIGARSRSINATAASTLSYESAEILTYRSS
jgi:hypothetical protein